MKQELKTKWITALRSGKYRKSTRVLKRYFKTTAPGHCCLGVLCEIIKNDFPHAEDLLQSNRLIALPKRSVTSCASLLDQETLAHVGLDSEQQRKLAGKNDKGATFRQIADYIEKKL